MNQRYIDSPTVPGFESPHRFYEIWQESVNKTPIINLFPSPLCPILAHRHAGGGVFCKSDLTFACKLLLFIAQSARAVEYRLLLCIGVRHPPRMSVLIITQNNLMVRCQYCCSFGRCGLLILCHHFQVYSGPEW